MVRLTSDNRISIVLNFAGELGKYVNSDTMIILEVVCGLKNNKYAMKIKCIKHKEG